MRVVRAAALALLAVGGVAQGGGVCEPAWSDEFGGMLDSIGPITCAAVFDDGTGSAIYFGGAHANPIPYGFPPYGVARQRNGVWEYVPGLEGVDLLYGLNLYAMQVFDDGSGPALYCAGQIQFADGQLALNIARRTGDGWAPVGAGLSGIVYDLAVFDEDGEGPGAPSLFATGAFDFSDSAVVSKIARWNGTAWTPVGTGLAGAAESTFGYSMTVVPSGALRGLYVSGRFGTAGGVASPGVARWTGEDWLAVPGAAPDETTFIREVGYLHDEFGPAIVAGRDYDAQAGIHRWDGTDWTAYPTYSTVVFAFAEFAGNSRLVTLGGLRINGQNTLHQVVELHGDGQVTPLVLPPGTLYGPGCLFGMDLPPEFGGGLLVTGRIDTINDGEIVKNAIVWDDVSWRQFDEFRGVDGTVTAFAADPATGTLHVGGSFLGAADIYASNAASFDGEAWSALGEGFNSQVAAMAVHDLGSGVRLFASGNFTHSGEEPLARGVAMLFPNEGWISWAAVDTGTVSALASIDGALYAGGSFFSIGGEPSQFLSVRAVGQPWKALGEGLQGGLGVNAITAWNGGIVAGGFFHRSGATTLNNIGFFDGQSWHALGAGFNSTVRALAVFQGDLYAAGDFISSGGQSMLRFARWNGAAWEALPGQMAGFPRAMAVFDDGRGEALFVGGTFTYIVPQEVNYLARWDGEEWTSVGMGLDGAVIALATATVSGRESLFVGGGFGQASGRPSYGIARWDACAAACGGDTNGDLVIDFEDLNAVVGAFNTAEGDAAYDASADLDQDGDVDFGDLNTVVSAFNTECGAVR